MKSLLLAITLCNTALLSAMDGSAKSLRAKQQYAHHIADLRSKLDCKINHADAFSSSLTYLVQDASRGGYTSHVQEQMQSKISALRETHAELNRSYNELLNNSPTPEFSTQLDVVAAALAVLNNHIESAIVRNNALKTYAQASAPLVVIPNR
jgi:hypothetical protein